MEFIDFRLQWDGKINRGELVNYFGISIQQASLDLAKYAEIASGNLEYDSRQKHYRATSRFKPAIANRNAESFLNELLGLKLHPDSSAQTFIGVPPPYEIVQMPTRHVSTRVLAELLQGIKATKELEIQYQSMHEPAKKTEWIAPHALAFDGDRWHVRAWSTSHREFRDFVVSRIQEIFAVRDTTVSPANDINWNTLVTIKLRSRQNLTAHQRHAVEAEFEMKSGVLEVTVRKALLNYFVRGLPGISAAKLQTPQIEIVNATEVRKAIRDTLPTN